jgi:hypothetical protein
MERHRFDPLSFIFGLLFVAVAAVALIGVDLLDVRDLAWIAPALLVIAGGALLLSSSRSPAGFDGSEEPLGGQARASDAPEMGRAFDER